MPSQKPGTDCASTATASTAGAQRGRAAASTPSTVPNPAASARDAPSSTKVDRSAGHSTRSAGTA